jgi:hypothetical protein
MELCKQPYEALEIICHFYEDRPGLQKYFMDICPYLPAIWVDCLKIRQLYFKANSVVTPCNSRFSLHCYKRQEGTGLEIHK